MASVQYMVCKADIFPTLVIDKHASLQDVEKANHFAALIIQRVYRGYLARKEIKRLNRAATVLQKYIRGFLVRWHLPDYLRQYMCHLQIKFYNRMATKIQALWRGYRTRNAKPSAKDIIAMNLRIEKANREIRDAMHQAFVELQNKRRQELIEEAKKWIVYILFKLHHLLRTKVKEGIYSVHGESNLSKIEQLIKAVPMYKYMKELKEIYYEKLAKPKKRKMYIYQTEKLQKIEAEYRNRDRSHEPRENFILRNDTNLHDKPFVLDTRITRSPYQRAALYSDKYTGKAFSLDRSDDKSKRISDKDFDLHVLKEEHFKEKPPPYYLDLWARFCKIHNIPDT